MEFNVYLHMYHAIAQITFKLQVIANNIQQNPDERSLRVENMTRELIY